MLNSELGTKSKIARELVQGAVFEKSDIEKKAQQQKAEPLVQMNSSCPASRRVHPLFVPELLLNSRSVAKFFYPAAWTSSRNTFKNVSFPTACGITQRFRFSNRNVFLQIWAVSGEKSTGPTEAHEQPPTTSKISRSAVRFGLVERVVSPHAT
mgnify:CR=1 FL=1